jgi:HUS1 checkpoint protein
VTVDGHPSTRRPRNKFSSVKVDAKDWSNLLRVSQVAKNMLLCICEERALVVYVFISDDFGEEGPVLTYYIPAYD